MNELMGQQGIMGAGPASMDWTTRTSMHLGTVGNWDGTSEGWLRNGSYAQFADAEFQRYYANIQSVYTGVKG